MAEKINRLLTIKKKMLIFTMMSMVVRITKISMLRPNINIRMGKISEINSHLSIESEQRNPKLNGTEREILHLKKIRNKVKLNQKKSCHNLPKITEVNKSVNIYSKIKMIKDLIHLR